METEKDHAAPSWDHRCRRLTALHLNSRYTNCSPEHTEDPSMDFADELGKLVKILLQLDWSSSDPFSTSYCMEEKTASPAITARGTDLFSPMKFTFMEALMTRGFISVTGRCFPTPLPFLETSTDNENFQHKLQELTEADKTQHNDREKPTEESVTSWEEGQEETQCKWREGVQKVNGFLCSGSEEVRQKKRQKRRQERQKERQKKRQKERQEERQEERQKKRQKGRQKKRQEEKQKKRQEERQKKRQEERQEERQKGRQKKRQEARQKKRQEERQKKRQERQKKRQEERKKKRQEERQKAKEKKGQEEGQEGQKKKQEERQEEKEERQEERQEEGQEGRWKKQQQRKERWREQKSQVEVEQRTKVRVQTEDHVTEGKRDTVSRSQSACDTATLQQLQDSAAENPARKSSHYYTPGLQQKMRWKSCSSSESSNRQPPSLGRFVAAVFSIFLLFGAALASANQAPVRLYVEGWGDTLQGKSYSLVCVVSPPQAAHTAYVWFKNGKLLGSETEGVLKFAPLTKGNEGNYQCGFQQGDAFQAILSDSFLLRVIVLEKISLVSEVEVEEGQTVILNCSVHSDPTASLTWRLGGKTLHTVRSNSDSLVLHNASQYHLQVVECEAYNEGLVLGFLDAYSLIRLKGTYEIIPTPYLSWRGDTVLHQRFVLECIVGVLPNQGVNVHLTYTWYKDHKVIEGQSDMILVFPSLSREDRGLYTCTARNGKPRTTSLESNTWDLLVLIPPVVHMEPPDKVITRATGDTLTLTCKVTEAFPGVAAEGYRWSYLPSSGGQLRPLEGRESTLTLDPLTREDSGQYICQAWNYVDFGGLLPPGNASISVDVMYLQNITLTPSSEVNEGDPVNLTCSVDSKPAARLSWLVEGREVRHVTANVDHYVVERAACSDNKTYTCRASNPNVPGLEITRSSHVLVNCTKNATEMPQPPYSIATPANTDMQDSGSSSSHTADLGVIVQNIVLVVAITAYLL